MVDPPATRDIDRGVRLSLIFPLTVACAVALTGCAKKKDSITLGLAGAQTGSDAQIGTSMLNGSQIAIDEWNAKGGVLGKHIDTIVLDDEGKSDKAVTIAQTLSDDGVAAVIGHFNSNLHDPCLARL